MKKLRHAILLVSLFAAGSLEAQNWQLVWQDEFTNGISSDWVFETGTGSGGWGNNELQYYRRENATVSNGQLVITARRESFGGMNYTSARMKTQGRKSWKYGKIEARIAMPSFQGIWPAFWMLGDNITSVGWPACGEIDIMEHVNTGNQVFGTIHWQDHNNTYAQYSGNTTANNITTFHVYTIEWDGSLIKWFVDGVKFHEASIANGVNGTSEFHNNFFLLLNLAVGGNWPGFTIDNNAFPTNMYVDYVRVYQNNGTPTGPVTAYQDCNYGGFAAALPVGSYTLSQLQARGIANDYISSLRVQSGYQIRLYANDNFTGTSVLKTGDDACLVDDNFNDQATSVVVSQVTSGFSTTIQAENFSAMNGVQVETTTDAGGGQNVGYIEANDWMAYNSINIPTTGSYQIEYRVASPSGGTLSADLNAGSIVLGQVGIPNTGGWQNWTTVSHTVNINAGTYNFGIFASTGGWNINWFRITRLSSARLATTALAPEEAIAVDSKRSFDVYPNPARNEINIVTDKDIDVKIMSTSGKEFLRAKSQNGKIDISSLPAGIYYVSTVEDGKVVNKRLAVKK
ncbi:carbohydrate-binding protein [Pseudochryseolinea flava]|uniref:Carbohydrate-binding protein n=1 Tax=Pseudochryseolinea flava TaxID=2059302 RepID=A0A364Y4G8_9BACT|nr:carbohydrate-binding protein [Pseudochryseolinea flava]RAW01649.1 carbohydrate-binding protein [Pseudochryseolinea flava]